MVADATAALREANLAFARTHPGEGPGRQPVHTVYGGAQLFAADSVPKLGAIALRALDQYAGDAAALGDALSISGHSELATIEQRVRDKLAREPIEDFRIDFEDGYGNRPDDEEDGHAAAVAREVTTGMREGTLSPFIGMRIKPLNEELRARSVRTLDLVITALVEAGGIPEHWIVTIPKITVIEQVEYTVNVLRALEHGLGLDDGTLRFEIMVETPQIVLDASGGSLLPRVIDVSDGRLRGAHFGTYDYTASCNITAANQRMQHPTCDFAKHFMQAAFAGTDVWLSDGSTTVMPVPIHRVAAGGTPLSDVQHRANAASVHHAWRLHFNDVRHSLAGGFYQGWDLHPAQLVTRYAALYSFFLEGIDAAGVRLSNFVGKAAQATLVGDVFDDAATGQGLLNFFLRGINSGAITEEEALNMTGLTAAEFRGRSFVSILRARGAAKGEAAPR
ncbi:MAG: phosphoenolpyruvate kinase [Gemmatimonadaceae bacterium]|nr:phosphoenolpyruvate kinase [Gemmatimonadaceae bacterium]